MGNWSTNFVSACLMSARLSLEPLSVEHAAEMFELLNDPGLHQFVGGEPLSLTELQEQYDRQTLGRSPDGSQRWLNWVIRRLEDARPVGTVQATVSSSEGGIIAEIAWVIATRYQRCGYAREAVDVMVTWLRKSGVNTFMAHIHPGHRASQGVARGVGLSATTVVVGGEIRWQG